MKVTFNLDYELPLHETVEIPSMTIVVRVKHKRLFFSLCTIFHYA